MSLLWTYFWLCLAAMLGGAINSIAGGGTLLTFPTLLAALSSLGRAEAAVIANATSTVALVPGSLAGAWGYRSQMKDARRWFMLLLAPSIAGGGIGSLLVTRLDPRYFAAVVPWLLLLAAALFLADTLLRKSAEVEEPDPKLSHGRLAATMLFQFAVAIYGGYFGAAMSILMLSALALMGLGHIHQMNALKTTLGSCINGTSVVIFVAEGRVAWRYALPMTVASILGGYLGARASLRIEPRRVRWLVIAIGFGLAAYYFVR
jgi:uncharacterized protein